MKTLRARLTATSLAVAALGLLAGLWAMSMLAQRALVDQLHDELLADARTVAAAADPAAAQAALRRLSPERLAQVRDPDGAVLAASTHAIRQSADLDELEVRSGSTTDSSGAGWVTGTSQLTALGEGWDALTVASTGIDGAHVTVAAPLGDLSAVVDTFTGLALVGLPVLVSLIGVLVWTVLGRALRPVDNARWRAATAADIYPPPLLRSTGAGSEIDALVGTLDDLLDRAASSVRTERRFLADASHELLSPLTVLRTNLEVALRRESTPDVQTALRRCLQTQARLETLARQLLMLAKTQDTTASPVDDVDLAALARDVAEEIAPTTAVTISIDAPPQLTMPGDHVALRQLLDNLVRNACRHATTNVALTLTADTHAVRVHVDDDGPGIPPADRQRIFQPFMRLDTARDRHAGGAGLGLAIVNAVVQRHGGHVEVTISEFNGARFTAELPRQVCADDTTSGTARSSGPGHSRPTCRS